MLLCPSSAHAAKFLPSPLCSTPANPFGARDNVITFPHRVVERPVPAFGRHFQQQEDVSRVVSFASSAKGFYSNETQNFLSSFSSRPATVAFGATSPQPQTPSHVSFLRTAQSPRAQPSAQPVNTPLIWGGGFGTSRRVEHLHRDNLHRDTGSACFAPLGYPRGVVRLSESPAVNEAKLRSPSTSSGGPSIFSNPSPSVPMHSSRGAHLF